MDNARFEQGLLRDGDEIRNLIGSLPFRLDWENGPWIAGGAVRWLLGDRLNPVRDIDVFFASFAQFKAARDRMGTCWCRSQVAETYTLDVSLDRHFTTSRGKPLLQFVTKDFYQSPEEIIESIDFTVCRAVTDGTRWLADRATRKDIQDRRLSCVGPTHDSHKLGRFTKYVTMGYLPTRETMLRCCGLDTPDETSRAFGPTLRWMFGTEGDS